MFKSLLVLFIYTQFAFAGKIQSLSFEMEKGVDPYFQISKIIVEELESSKSVSAQSFVIKSDPVIMKVDKLIAIGKKIYKIIEAGKPVVHTSFMPTVTVIPFDKEASSDVTFSEMTNWSVPKARSYKVTYKNAFGMNVITFTYTVLYQYNGKYKGTGKYLAGVSLYASAISVSWGFDFSAETKLVQITNHGSSTNQVAGATFRINYVAKTILKEIRSSESFHISGNGELIKY